MCLKFAALLFLSFFFFEAENLTVLRLDVELALQTGLPTLFRSDAIIPVTSISDNSRVAEEQLLSIDFRLSRLMLDLLSFSDLLNDRGKQGRTKLDPLSYMELLVSLLYPLIGIAPLGQRRFMSGGLYDDLTHLTMLALMTTLLPEYSRDDSSHLLSDTLERAILNLHFTFAGIQDSGFALLLWALFIGGISVLKGKDHRCLILKTCERLNLHDWADIGHQLCGFPWIHTLHDVRGRCLWEDAQRKSMENSWDFLQLKA